MDKKYDVDGNEIKLKKFDPDYEIGMREAYNQEYGAAMYFLRSSAEKGNPDAQNELGVCYERKQEYEKAMFWYKIAANKGNDRAWINLGLLYEYGHGVKKDYTEAFNYYAKALHNKYPEAYYRIGLLHNEGKGFEKDDTKAYQYWLCGSRLKTNYDNQKNLFQLGYCNEFGIGTAVDYKKALEYYNKVVDISDMKVAKYNAALAYFHGRGTEVNIPKALRYLFDVAKRGYVDAMGKLSDIYYEALVVPQNDDVCVYWTKEAAYSYHLPSMLRLAKFNLKGELVEKDINFAYKTLKEFIKRCPDDYEEMWEEYKELKQYLDDEKFWSQLDKVREDARKGECN